MWLLDKRTLVISSAFCFRLRHGLRSLPWRDVESHHSQHALCTLDHVGFCQRSVARDVGRRFIFLSVLSGMDYKCPCVLVLIYIDARLSLRTTLTALQQSQLKVCSYFSHIFFCEIRPFRNWLFWLFMGNSNLPSLVEIFRISPLWRSLGRHFRFKGVCKRLATESNHKATLKQCKLSFRVKATWPRG